MTMALLDDLSDLVGRQAEGNVTMRGDGLVRFLTVSNTKVNFSVTTVS